MAKTSLSLEDHWESFILTQVATGRYGSATDVVRDALRDLETKNARLEALKDHLAEGLSQARRGEFVDDFSLDTLIETLDRQT